MLHKSLFCFADAAPCHAQRGAEHTCTGQACTERSCAECFRLKSKLAFSICLRTACANGSVALVQRGGDRIYKSKDSPVPRGKPAVGLVRHPILIHGCDVTCDISFTSSVRLRPHLRSIFGSQCWICDLWVALQLACLPAWLPVCLTSCDLRAEAKAYFTLYFCICTFPFDKVVPLSWSR